MRYLTPVLFACVASLVVIGTVTAEPGPAFRLGFADLAVQIPEIAGSPTEDEHYGPNGDSLQRTTTGLMVWRKADNWTAFTDGVATWINGPAGAVSRPNGERFSWEGETSPAAASTPTPRPVAQSPQQAAPSPTPAPAPRHYSPVVKAMDAAAADHGASIVALMAEVDAEWAKAWGWQPSRPTTIYLYKDGNSMADDLPAIFGRSLSPEERKNYATNYYGVSSFDARTKGWSVAMNLSSGMGSPDWASNMKTGLVHEYAHVMQNDVAGGAGPTWFKEGMAELCAYSKVPGSSYMLNRMRWLSEGKRRGTLPTITALSRDWNGIANWSPDRITQAYAVAYTGVQLLADRVGGAPLLEVLKRVRAGTDFNVALKSITGYTVEELDAAVRAKLQ